MKDIDLHLLMNFEGNFDTSVNNTKGEGKGLQRDSFWCVVTRDAE